MTTRTPQEMQQASLDQVRKLQNLQYLQKMMKPLQMKLTMGTSLTPEEREIVAEIARQQLMKPQSSVHVEDGKTRITESHDIEPMLHAIKARREADDANPTKAKNGAKWVGSIDLITANNWAKECGFAVGTAGWNDFAKKQLLKGEHRRFTGRY